MFIAHLCFSGRVCGLCGNFNGDRNDDFMTPQMLPETLANDFGDSWRVESSCPDAVIPRNPCVINKHRAPWAHKMCSIIRSDVFKPCHEVVSPGPIVTQNKLIRLFRTGDQFLFITRGEGEGEGEGSVLEDLRGHIVFRGNGGISRRQQSIKGNQSKFTAD